ncbi:uncharacterized protein F4817DRAFT_105737 [Daldinia loculata]|uniref:uncharacterized protein n=1 Tax=Daldinia loculata TaxID=103429 RepID=UPI0020C50A3F|nr:uncharacterized protein F4817DRAFT_105737 [Daldinia loculata]KAI1647340.1 hypothetical protein F4817DRAFT_105737 [Daldinia loculata]
MYLGTERQRCMIDHADPCAPTSKVSPTSPHSTPPQNKVTTKERVYYVLPIAFIAAFAISATSASTVYAYASILCTDPTHCEDNERNRYAGAVAIATTLSNSISIVAICLLRQWAETNPKLGLCLWLICRGLSVIVLSVGVIFHNIYIAIAGRIFEGLATDNILHYTLAAVYVRAGDESRFPRLMGTSLALYMIGMSISPALVTLLPHFLFSFLLAFTLLGSSLFYLLAFVPGLTPVTESDYGDHSESHRGRDAVGSFSIFTPIRYLVYEPTALFASLAIFFYNTAQAYLFPAIMVYATLKFGFTSVENSYIVSIAAGTSSICLFTVFYIIPWLHVVLSLLGAVGTAGNTCNADVEATVKTRSTAYMFYSNMFYAVLSMSIQAVTLPAFLVIKTEWHIYVLIILVALGLAAPSFIKSYTVAIASSKDSALAGLAIMESLGGLFSSIILGVIQSSISQNSVFIVASMLVGAAILCLAGSYFTRR